MSAFILEDRNFDAMLGSLIQNTIGRKIYLNGTIYDLCASDTLDLLGNILKVQNYASVDYRYRDNAEYMADRVVQTGIKPYEYEHYPKYLDNVQVLKLCNCYDYQACETADYENTLACALVDRIRSACIISLPGYDDCEWGL